MLRRLLGPPADFRPFVLLLASTLSQVHRHAIVGDVRLSLVLILSIFVLWPNFFCAFFRSEISQPSCSIPSLSEPDSLYLPLSCFPPSNINGVRLYLACAAVAFAADVNVPFFCRHRTRKQSRPSCDGETIAASVRSTVRCPALAAKLSPSVSQTLLSPTNSTALLVSSLLTVSSRMARVNHRPRPSEPAVYSVLASVPDSGPGRFIRCVSVWTLKTDRS